MSDRISFLPVNTGSASIGAAVCVVSISVGAYMHEEKGENISNSV